MIRSSAQKSTMQEEHRTTGHGKETEFVGTHNIMQNEGQDW